MEMPEDLMMKDQDSFNMTPKSKVKLTKNTKGLNWEISVVAGEENLMQGLMEAAVNIHKALHSEFGGDEK